jgi:hypothetical protein
VSAAHQEDKGDVKRNRDFGEPPPLGVRFIPGLGSPHCWPRNDKPPRHGKSTVGNRHRHGMLLWCSGARHCMGLTMKTPPSRRFDAQSGQQLWSQPTGSSAAVPLSAYSLNGTEYLAVVAGEAGNQQTPNLPAVRGRRVIAYRLDAAGTIDNDATGQVALANAVNGAGESASPVASSKGSASCTSQHGRRPWAGCSVAGTALC